MDQLKAVKRGANDVDLVCFLRMLAFTLNEMGRHCRARGVYSLGSFCDHIVSYVKTVLIEVWEREER